MTHRERLHHRPRVYRWRPNRWRATCPCGWGFCDAGTQHGASGQHFAFVLALAHAEGNLR